MDLVITNSMIKQNQGTHNLYNDKNVFNRNKKVILKPNSAGPRPPNQNEDQMAVQGLIKTANDKLNAYVNNEGIKKPDPVIVQVYLIFLRVGEIDNVKERFQADAYFEASWEDNSVDVKTGFDPHIHWDPELFIENAVGNLKQDIKYKVERKDNRTKVIEMRNIKGLFWERLELWDFPLDFQDLSITITSQKNKDEVKFEHSPYNESTINTEDFQQQQEWNLYTNIETQTRFIYDAWSNHDRPCFTISSKISRRPGYFVYNAYMLIFLISVLGFVPFSFAYSSPHFRIQTTCLLILSSVNFRWIVTQKLPTVSYLTILDKYAIGALIFLVSLCAWHAIIGSDMFSSIDKSLVKNIDNYALISIGILYFLFHLVYISYFIYKYSQYFKVGKEDEEETKEDDKKDKPDTMNDKNKAIEEGPRPISISNIKPSIKPVPNPKPTEFKPTTRSMDKNASDIRYDNLVESPSPSVASNNNYTQNPGGRSANDFNNNNNNDNGRIVVNPFNKKPNQ